MTRPPDLTPAEFNIMKVLWSLERATVAEVRSVLNRQAARAGTELAYTTVMTLLGRLAAKGAVQVDRSKEPFVYRAAHRRESVIGSRVRTFLQDVFDGKADSLVLQLVEDEALSVEDLRAIERTISAAEASETSDASETSETSDASEPNDASDPIRIASEVTRGATHARARAAAQSRRASAPPPAPVAAPAGAARGRRGEGGKGR